MCPPPSGVSVLRFAVVILLMSILAPSAWAVSVESDERLRDAVAALSAVESRVTGYAGAAEAAEYLIQALGHSGVTEIHRQSFAVPVPVDEGFTLSASGLQYRLHSVWPNLVRTSTLPVAGLRGRLIDAGGDVLSGLDGQDIEDRIVLLDYDSGTAWMDAFLLGASAVIFLETGPAHRKEAAQKFLGVPAAFPRLYAAAPIADDLRQLAKSGSNVLIEGRMSWVNVTATNLIGIIEGSDPDLRSELVMAGAHYDAMSSVPALAPGAEQASSAAALLELARALQIRPPRRSVALVLSDGHYHNLAGMRHLVPLLQQAAGRRPREADLSPRDAALVDRLGQFELRMFVGLDLSTGSDILGVGKPAAPFRTPLIAPPLTERLMGLAVAYEDSVLGGRRILGNGLRQDLSRLDLGGLPHVLPVGASVAALAGCPALIFQTFNDSRPLTDMPLDRFSDSNADRLIRLRTQVQLLTWLLPRLWEDEDLEAWEWGNDVFGTLRGQVVHFGPRSYLPDQPTAGALVRVRLREPTMVGVRPDVWAVADDSGRFEIPGIETRIIYTRPVRIEAYGLDSLTGEVTAVSDWGLHGERRLPGRRLTVQMDDFDKEVQIVTAEMKGLALPDIFDPRNLITPERLELIDAITEAELPVLGGTLPLTPVEMDLFGYKNRVGSWIEPAAVAFAPADTRVKVVMTTGTFGLGRRLLLLNSDSRKPTGHGYIVEGEGRLTHSIYRVAHDVQSLNEQRIGNLRRHGVRNGRLSSFSEKARDHLSAAELARAQNRHQAFIERSRRAWAYAISAYRDVERTQAGVIKGALFLLAALLPFAHFMERLLFGFSDVRRQVIAYFAFFLAGFLALRYLHPAFELSISPVIILLGFVILSLGLLVTGIGISRLNRELVDLAGGHGRGDTGRAGTMLTSVSVGLAHLRRRPLRTALTCSTLVLLTFVVLSFTSIQESLRANWVDTQQAAPYSGALVRMRSWRTMEMNAYDALRARFGPERTVPRAWMSVTNLSSSFRLDLEQGPGEVSRRSAGVLGFAGLTAREAELVAPQQDLVAGRWLAVGEQDVCLLPTGVADSLGIAATDLGSVQVRIFGESFRVIGLLAPQALDRPDLNGEPLTPLDPEAQKPVESEMGTSSGRLPAFTHLPGAQVAVLPFASLLRWEKATLASVGIVVSDDDAHQVLTELSETLDLNLFVGFEGRRYLVNTVGVASVSGLGALVVPVGIAALVVLNTMLGAVYERTREIGTFNAVGLAPNHVSGLFMSEAVAFAVIGAVLGYLLGQAAAQGMGALGLFPGLQLNYSSMSAVMTLGLVIVLVVLSALYPAHMAGRICTPGVERRWRPPAPEGHCLQMRLPFTLNRRDAMGMAVFQAEFWAAHQEQSIGAGFYVESLAVCGGTEGDHDAAARICVEARTWLAPFDQGVVQEVSLLMAPGIDPRYCDIDVTLNLVSGDQDTWTRVSRTFLDDLRKQFLMWRALSDTDRELYVARLSDWLIPKAQGEA